ncbi:MAG: DUF429 domain-containing protein [Spirochaetales bacterium]|nr:DUF429 domain-containing protein [Spirochaetales bacterium]
MIIIGVDSAVQPVNNGLTLGSYNSKSFKILDKWDRTGNKNDLEQNMIETLISWIEREKQVLLCIDSPLGWPSLFGKALSGHLAGKSIEIDTSLSLKDEMDNFFKRKTDIDIAKRYKKIPLEVSADRIARTAFSTLKRIGILNTKIKPSQPIDLLWNNNFQEKTEFKGMIEVYPAVTLLSQNLNIRGYKKTDSIHIRKNLLNNLKGKYNIHESIQDFDFTTVDHDFDSLVCCLAGIDFIEGRCKPADIENDILKTEGWIWAKK